MAKLWIPLLRCAFCLRLLPVGMEVVRRVLSIDSLWTLVALMTEQMRAMSVTDDGVEMCEMPIPRPGPSEVRVKVIASAVNPGEEKVISGEFVGRFLHARTSPLVLGWDVAGNGDAIGSGVVDMSVGQPVWGHLAYSSSQRQGAYAEYVTLPRKRVAFRSTTRVRRTRSHDRW